ncbi:glycosyltransferase family 2 protein [uncultured Thiothrix sp.]|uniref:glycosyltransferase family 2 protein n=1 Tax=uncultured Thiothrix sp. TaxID=223185 RepID=UPI002614C9B4|nr:glycosyltransferase family 2 protein [uncultured Thiothrix sp.]
MTQAFKIKLAAIAKDEGFYLPLWVYHHLRFGFDVLDIRINDTTDNSWQILEKLKAIYGERLRFSLADEEMAECQATGVHFQTYIYNKIYQETLTEDFTHLMFLDIDEYWCSVNFSETIKDFLAKVSDFDVCMFQWLMELPNPEKKLNDFSFKLIMKGQHSNHVKSLVNLSAPVKEVRIHNFLLEKGKYILPDQTEIDFEKNNQNNAIVPGFLFEPSRLKLSGYFIFHFVFRSQDEYISSLLRGNKQSGGSFFLKRNRHGFIPSFARRYILRWSILEDNLLDYRKKYIQVVKVVNDELNEAGLSVLERKKVVLDYLESDIFLQQVNENKMRGIDQSIYGVKKINNPLKAKVYDIDFDKQTGYCRFSCEIDSQKIDYSLVITQSFAKEKVPAKFHLLSTEQQPDSIIKRFSAEIAIGDLTYIVYSGIPPFCLAAQINGQLFLLEMYQFRELGNLIYPEVMQLRKLMFKSAAENSLTTFKSWLFIKKANFLERVLKN